MQQPPTATTHALGLPEIVSAIVQYLEAPDVLACSTVSKSLRTLFVPYVWRNLHFGSCQLKCNRTPFARSVAIKNLSGTGNSLDMDALLEHAPLVRSLIIHDHESITPLQLGAACTRLESLTVSGLLLWEDSHTDVHWINCMNMVQRNRLHLRSLSLVGWKYDETKRPTDQPFWSPLQSCAQSWNLRSLKIQDCRLRERDWEAFWILCERLEALEFKNTMDMTMVLMTPGKGDDGTSACFPRLRSLTLHTNDSVESNQILGMIIGQCPVLRTLKWNLCWRYLFPMDLFTELFEASTWPELDTIAVKHFIGMVLDEEYRRLLEAAGRPLRRLDFQLETIQPATFGLIRTHFSTLETIDLSYGSRDTSDWTIEVLASCPMLRKITSVSIHAQDLLASSMPWVCHRLQKFEVAIDMGFPNRGPDRELSKVELEQCRKVYERLAELRELRVLDLLSGYIRVCVESNVAFGNPYESPITLPLRLDAGLDLLGRCTRLERIRFWGGTEPVEEQGLQWMVEHWKRLWSLVGIWTVLAGTAHEVRDKFLWEGRLKEWLRGHGVTTEGSSFGEYEAAVRRRRAMSI
ncbi:MAG: hypothetical protein J3Q66DRAFT_331810 [Benniella sp.]|nr:MAG: hypothetical protein J3Q66DRAFT_331810 [Benniella sp.]